MAYAAQRAGADGELTIVHAYGPPPEWRSTVEWDRSVLHHEQYGRRLFEELPRDVLGEAHVREELVLGPPARCLVEIADARGAEEIVVGSRGFGPFRAMLGTP